MMILNFIEALVFGLFVIIMMFDQLSAIFEIADEYEQEYGIKKSRYQCVKEVFGSKFGLDWFLPVKMSNDVHINFAQEVQEVLSYFNPSRNYSLLELLAFWRQVHAMVGAKVDFSQTETGRRLKEANFDPYVTEKTSKSDTQQSGSDLLTEEELLSSKPAEGLHARKTATAAKDAKDN